LLTIANYIRKEKGRLSGNDYSMKMVRHYDIFVHHSTGKFIGQFIPPYINHLACIV